MGFNPEIIQKSMNRLLAIDAFCCFLLLILLCYFSFACREKRKAWRGSSLELTTWHYVQC